MAVYSEIVKSSGNAFLFILTRSTEPIIPVSSLKGLGKVFRFSINSNCDSSCLHFIATPSVTYPCPIIVAGPFKILKISLFSEEISRSISDILFSFAETSTAFTEVKTSFLNIMFIFLFYLLIYNIK